MTEYTPLSRFRKFISRVSALATEFGNQLQLRGFKTGGAAGQVPRKVSSADFDWTWSDAASTWDDIVGKPSTFPPSAHTHTIANVTGLQAALNGKAAINSPQFTGIPVAPTASFDTETGQVATTAFVHGVVGDASFIRYDQSQGLDTSQQAQARTNINFEQGVTLTLSGLATAAGNIPDGHTVFLQHTSGAYYRSGFLNIKNTVKAETVNLTGNQTKAGTLTVSSPIVSSGTPTLDTHLPSVAQVRGQIFSGFTPMRKFAKVHNNMVGSDITIDCTALSPNWTGDTSYNQYWRTVEFCIFAQATSNISNQYMLYRAMFSMREHSGTWHQIGKQVLVNVASANAALGAWQVSDIVLGGATPVGIISVTHDAPELSTTCILQCAYSYY